MKSHIMLISLGGTIAMAREAANGGVVPNLSAHDIVAAMPVLSDYALIESRNFLNKPSTHITFDELVGLVAEIRSLADRGIDGIVITQGTDTIEETSWMLDLLLPLELPVVVTGAMRNPGSAGADGPANLLAAVQVAASQQARNLGVLVVFNDQIHSARFVAKTHTSSPSAFQSPGSGPIGWVTEGEVRITLLSMRHKAILQRPSSRLPHVSILKPCLGEDGRLIDACVEAGVQGLVIEAAGGGHTSDEVADALGRVAAKIPVILSSRTGAGYVLNRTYGFVGSEIDLLSRGLISACGLNGCKARILLCLLLSEGKSIEHVSREFPKFAQTSLNTR